MSIGEEIHVKVVVDLNICLVAFKKYQFLTAELKKT